MLKLFLSFARCLWIFFVGKGLEAVALQESSVAKMNQRQPFLCVTLVYHSFCWWCSQKGFAVGGIDALRVDRTMA